MDGNSSNSGGRAAAAATSSRPHWRHRDRSATAVYVVHPAEFRSVVQQLTGAAAPPPPSATAQQHGGSSSAGNNGDEAAAAMAVEAAAATKRSRTEGEKKGSMEQRTLAQMHNDCMAWAHEC
ncbi:hypothetical protein BRADI_4g04497v3 [Brachypodium distachyon]|uniref:VQ domain-containing protein n=1 Tax=Brachypodium distachyon TaxID=15368 RepID=A0A0Q3PB71_BRADI|nr:hypothetical protein BRADI_4g04497v3 [Brachypodium distachyon]